MKKLILIITILICQFSFGNSKLESIEYKSINYLKISEYVEIKKDNIISTKIEMIPQAILAVIKKGVKKVIRAMDLVMQRLQKYFLHIQNVLEKAKNLMAESKLGEITEWVQKKKELFDKYYDDLWRIKNIIDNIKSIKTSIASQAKLIDKYKLVLTRVLTRDLFNDDEKKMIQDVYTTMLAENINHITSMTNLITNYKIQMDDGDRLELITEYSRKINSVASDFNGFTTKILKLAMARDQEVNNNNAIKELNNIKL